MSRKCFCRGTIITHFSHLLSVGEANVRHVLGSDSKMRLTAYASCNMPQSTEAAVDAVLLSPLLGACAGNWKLGTVHQFSERGRRRRERQLCISDNLADN